MTKIDISKAVFVLSCSALLVAYGVAIGSLQIFPYSFLKFAKDSLTEVSGDARMIFGVRPTDHLKPARYDGEGVTLLDADRTSPGLTLMGGFFDNGLEIRLVRLDGTLVNRWPLSFTKILREPNHIRPSGSVPQSDWHTSIHGIQALPDGSVLFNFEFNGAVKLSRCGEIQWTLPEMTHHSVDQASDGSFWISGMDFVSETSPYPLLRLPFNSDTLLKVSQDGRILSKIFLMDIIFENNLEPLLFSNGLSGLATAGAPEVTHLNDIEELSSEMASAFPQFAAGDLLLSLRHYNLVMVVDPVSLAVRWYQIGPWMSQHDPDYLANGLIRIFSNNTDGTQTGTILGGSTIVEVDPSDGTTRVVYGARADQKMYSDIRSKHQNLENGNLLVTEAHGGRIFEVDAQGKIVWEFVNRYDNDTVAVVMDAIRYNEEYFSVSNWSCD